MEEEFEICHKPLNVGLIDYSGLVAYTDSGGEHEWV